jgi:VanZ family protein
VLVYAVLFVLVERALRGERWARRGSIPAAWLATLAYACSDEWHQTFVAGRSGQVGFDMLGATLAAAVTLLIRRRSAPGSSIAAPATIPVSEPAP